MNDELLILKQAVKTFNNETGLNALIDTNVPFKLGSQVDATITITDYRISIPVQVVKWAQTKPINYLSFVVRNFGEEVLLVTNYVNPIMGKKLKEANIQFLDTVGNAFIVNRNCYIYIIGNRERKLQIKTSKNRAFETQGLRVVFAFLCNQELLNTPYRYIAEKTGVSVGTIGWVINGLKEAGYLVKRKKGNGRLIRKLQLFERWVDAYNAKLKPKLLIGHFLGDEEDEYWWDNFPIEEYNGLWGGEIAAEKLTKYLKPKIVTIYLPKRSAIHLIRHLRLTKARTISPQLHNLINLYTPIFNIERPLDLFNDYGEGENEIENQFERYGITHPILIYADLIATGNPRNIETARKISDKYLIEYFSEN
jgi:hypothetical protein